MESLNEYGNQILAVVNRISKIASSIKNLASKGENQKRDQIALVDLIEDSLFFCKERFKNCGIDLQIKDIPKDIKINCHPIQISQVFLNLLNNSYDAI